jgi:predicted acetyltransferase
MKPLPESFKMHEIKFFSSSYDQCKCDFIEFKNANRDIKRNERYFDWRYQEKPVNLKPVIIWAENGDRQKIGSLSVTPHWFQADHQMFPLGIIGDISVSKKWRGKGIAEKMFIYLLKLEEIKTLKAFIVMPNEPATRSLKRAGWQPVLKLERYIKLITVDEKIKPWIKSSRLLRLTSTFLNYFLKLFSVETFLKQMKPYKGEIVGIFDERFNDLWNSQNKKGAAIGLRNKEYLTWRYTHHPEVKYLVFTLSDHDRLCGYLIFHVHEKQCYIDDLFFLSEKNMATYLMYHFLKYLRKNKAVSSISIRISQDVLSGWFLYRFGFIKRSDCLNFMIRDNRQGTYFWQNNRHWFLTAGDKEV